MTAATYSHEGTTTPTPNPYRAIGVAAAATGVVAFSLLAIHAGGNARTFADLLQEEAGNQMMDAVVHGGFIFVLAAQMACYALLTRMIAVTRVGAAAGLVFFAFGSVFFAFGSVFLGASLLMDGLVVPAVASQYAAPAAAEKIDYAKSLFVLMTNFIRFAMPIGLSLQALGLIAWGWSLFAGRLSRPAGLYGLIGGAAILVALVVGVMTMNPMALMAAMAGMAIWAMVAGAVMIRARA